MESDIIRVTTSDNIECLIAFICSDGFKNQVKEDYVNKAKNFVFGKSRDVYIIDVKLAKMLAEISHKSVLGCGASLSVNVDYMNGGGVIGDPFSQSESAGDGMERQQNGLWCIAYSGRFGCVFNADEETSGYIFEKVNMQCRNDIKAVINIMEKLLSEKCDTFIIASDGCGKGAYRYVSAGSFKKIKSME